ncbi:MAG: hypothetical protein AAGH19_11095, partial [Pseudomonadota bacterium]
MSVLSWLTPILFWCALIFAGHLQLRRYENLPPEMTAQLFSWRRQWSGGLIGGLIGILVYFLLPRWLSFEIAAWASLVGMFGNLVFMYQSYLPRVRALKTRANRAEMAKRGKEGVRLADTQRRQLRDVIPIPWLIAPWIAMAFAVLLPVFLFKAHSNSPIFTALMTLVSFGGLALGNWVINYLSQEPMDFRGTNPERVRNMVLRLRRQQLRMILASQFGLVLMTWVWWLPLSPELPFNLADVGYAISMSFMLVVVIWSGLIGYGRSRLER